jgi:adenylyl- and sulfurtransferase ThiI
MGYKVDLNNPDRKIVIEVRDRCFVYTYIFAGPGGLPLGASGSAIGKLNNEKDLLSNVLMMKRGMSIVVLGKANKELLKKMQSWSIGREIRNIKKLSDTRTKIIISPKDEIKKNYLVLNPLSGFSEKEIETMLKKL